MDREREDNACRCRGITPRQFLHGVGASAVVVSAAAHLAAREAKASGLLPAGELAKVTLAVEAQGVAITTLAGLKPRSRRRLLDITNSLRKDRPKPRPRRLA